MEGFDDREERVRKHQHLRVEEGAEELLELSHRGEKKEVVIVNRFGDTEANAVDGVAGEEDGLIGLLQGFEYGNRGRGVFREVAGEESKVGLFEGAI